MLKLLQVKDCAQVPNEIRTIAKKKKKKDRCGHSHYNETLKQICSSTFFYPQLLQSRLPLPREKKRNEHTAAFLLAKMNKKKRTLDKIPFFPLMKSVKKK